MSSLIFIIFMILSFSFIAYKEVVFYYEKKDLLNRLMAKDFKEYTSSYSQTGKVVNTFKKKMDKRV